MDASVTHHQPLCKDIRGPATETMSMRYAALPAAEEVEAQKNSYRRYRLVLLVPNDFPANWSITLCPMLGG